MSTFGEIATATKNLSTKTILKEVLRDVSIHKFIFKTIKNRTQSTGIAGDGTKLRTNKAEQGEFYSAFTMFLKQGNSGIAGITNHVTLTESGGFWDSLKFELLENSFLIDADFVKSDNNMYDNFSFQFGSQKEFEDAVLSLTNAELQTLLNNYIVPEFLKKFYAKL